MTRVHIEGASETLYKVSILNISYIVTISFSYQMIPCLAVQIQAICSGALVTGYLQVLLEIRGAADDSRDWVCASPSLITQQALNILTKQKNPPVNCLGFISIFLLFFYVWQLPRPCPWLPYSQLYNLSSQQKLVVLRITQLVCLFLHCLIWTSHLFVPHTVHHLCAVCSALGNKMQNKSRKIVICQSAAGAGNF